MCTWLTPAASGRGFREKSGAWQRAVSTLRRRDQNGSNTPGRGGELNPMKEEEFFRKKGEGESPVPDSTLGLGGKRPPDIPPRPSAKAHF